MTTKLELIQSVMPWTITRLTNVWQRGGSRLRIGRHSLSSGLYLERIPPIIKA
jgi:hypothetical protein